MKKLFLILFYFVLLSLNSFAIDDLQDVGIAKYAVLETLGDNIPLRSAPDENARRLSNLSKKTVLFADKQNKNYFRVELKENDYVWVNKKHVEVQAVIPEKRFEEVEKIIDKSKKDKFVFKIETNSNPPYQFIENGNNLEFNLYDVHFDPNEVHFSLKEDDFKITDKIDTQFQLEYKSDKPLFGYDFEKTEDNYYLTIKKPPKINPKKPLKDLNITLDAGHGGVETGVCAFDLKEKDINLQIVKKLKKEFKKEGANVYLTRKKDKKTDIYERTAFAKEKNSDILLSIHQNSLPNPKDVINRHGVGTYYYHNQSKPLAQSILNSLVSATNFKNDDIHNASFVLTRPTSQLSVLVECGYLICQQEAVKLKDKKFQKIVAKAIVQGCKNYLTESYK